MRVYLSLNSDASNPQDGKAFLHWLGPWKTGFAQPNTTVAAHMFKFNADC